MELDDLWDFSDPVKSEIAFRDRLDSLSDPDQIDECRTQLARSLGIQRRFAEADAELDRVNISSASLVVQVREKLERGRIRNSSGDKVAARPYFIRAFEIAESWGLDVLAIDAAHMVAIVEETAEKQLHWNNIALAISGKSDQPRAKKWRASLLNNVGWTYHDTAEYDRALQCFQEARSLREENGQADQERIARWCIARCLRSLARFEEALAMQHDIEGQDSSGYTEEEIGECLLALGRAEESKSYFAKAFQRLRGDAWFAKNETKRLSRLESLSQ